MVHDGAWPQIAGRRVAANVRWGQPDGVLELYQMGSEGPQWWTDYPDTVRGLPARGILTAATATDTCPKVIEHFGGAEVFALKMTTAWVGTSANVRHPADPQRAPLLHPEHHARRRRRRLRAPAGGHPGQLPRQQLGHRHLPRQSDAVDADGQRDPRGDARLGDERHAAAAEPLPDADRRHAGRPDAGRRWASRSGVPGIPDVDLPARELHLPGVRLRLGPAVQHSRRDRRADQRAAADPRT